MFTKLKNIFFRKYKIDLPLEKVINILKNNSNNVGYWAEVKNEQYPALKIPKFKYNKHSKRFTLFFHTNGQTMIFYSKFYGKLEAHDNTTLFHGHFEVRRYIPISIAIVFSIQIALGFMAFKSAVILFTIMYTSFSIGSVRRNLDILKFVEKQLPIT